MKKTKAILGEKKRLRSVKRLNKSLFLCGLVLDKNGEFLLVIRQGEIYFLSPYDKIPFYYEYYEKLSVKQETMVT